MPKLSMIQAEETKDIAIPFGEESLTLTIVPSKFTLGWQRKTRAIAKEEDINLLADHFFSVVKDWDLENNDGEKIRLDKTGIDQLSVSTFMAILERLPEAIVPNDKATSNA